MKIVIGYLYYDLLNLNGENGNVKILANQLKKQDIDVEIRLITTNKIIKQEEIDMFYMGGGTKQSLQVALQHMLKNKAELKKAIENHKFFLVTGNALDLFGKAGLNFFEFVTIKKPIYQKGVSFSPSILARPIVGFLNQETSIIKSSHPIFTNSEEGVHYNNFYGIKLFGPLLANNYLFLEYFIKQLVLYKDSFASFKAIDFKYEEKVYNNFKTK